jgi:hypothetical protein
MALVLVSAILVLYVIVSKVLLQWPLSLLIDAQEVALKRIADALIMYWSVAATIALLMIFMPAIIAWWLDVEAYRASQNGGRQTAGAVGSSDGLDFAPGVTVTAVISVLAPLLASPVADSLKFVVGALS